MANQNQDKKPQKDQPGEQARQGQRDQDRQQKGGGAGQGQQKNDHPKGQQDRNQEQRR